MFPWSTPPSSTTIDHTYASYDCVGDPACRTALPVVSLPKGNGKWGHSDLAGNMLELTLDRYAPYAQPCDDCAELAADSFREPRGGDYTLLAPGILTSFRYVQSPTQPLDNVRYVVGARCARAP